MEGRGERKGAGSVRGGGEEEREGAGERGARVVDGGGVGGEDVRPFLLVVQGRRAHAVHTQIAISYRSSVRCSTPASYGLDDSSSGSLLEGGASPPQADRHEEAQGRELCVRVHRGGSGLREHEGEGFKGSGGEGLLL